MTEIFVDRLVLAGAELASCHTHLLDRRDDVQALAKSIGRTDSMQELAAAVYQCAETIDRQAEQLQQLQTTLEQITHEVSRTENLLVERAAATDFMTQGWVGPVTIPLQSSEASDIGINF